MTHLRALVDGLRIGAIGVSDQGMRCDCNDSAEIILGRRARNLDELGNVLTFKRGDDEPQLPTMEVLVETTQKGDVVEVFVGQANTDSVERITSLRALELGSKGDVLLLFDDQATSDRTEEQLERRDQLAAVGQLAAGVTHEINNILTAILGWTQIAMRSPNQVEKVESALEIIDENSRRAKAIIDDVMGFARPTTVPIEPVQISEVSEEVLKVLSFEFHNDEIAIERSYREVPRVLVDRRKLFQVFLNIVLNAIQAMKDGGRLQVSTSIDGPLTTIEFRDSGHGMDPETEARVFDPGFTTKPPDGTGGGSGLGLTISRKLVERLGGSIHIESHLGIGTAFTVKLPSSQKSDLTKRSAMTKMGLAGPLRVLVVDDERHIREMIKESLENGTSEVVTAQDGFEAIALNGKIRFDLAIVDYSMPGISGQTLIDRLKQDRPKLSVVVLTGRLDSIELDSVGADEILRKPFDLSELLRVLVKAIS